MSKHRTWEILAWGAFETDGDEPGTITLMCPDCTNEAECETRGRAPTIIGAIGLSLILDPPKAKVPDGFMPTGIRCRKCGSVFVQMGLKGEEASDVR